MSDYKDKYHFNVKGSTVHVQKKSVIKPNLLSLIYVYSAVLVNNFKILNLETNVAIVITLFEI